MPVVYFWLLFLQFQFTGPPTQRTARARQITAEPPVHSSSLSGLSAVFIIRSATVAMGTKALGTDVARVSLESRGTPFRCSVCTHRWPMSICRRVLECICPCEPPGATIAFSLHVQQEDMRPQGLDASHGRCSEGQTNGCWQAKVCSPRILAHCVHFSTSPFSSTTGSNWLLLASHQEGCAGCLRHPGPPYAGD